MNPIKFELKIDYPTRFIKPCSNTVKSKRKFFRKLLIWLKEIENEENENENA